LTSSGSLESAGFVRSGSAAVLRAGVALVDDTSPAFTFWGLCALMTLTTGGQSSHNFPNEGRESGIGLVAV
jgi:hypothetical protein